MSREFIVGFISTGALNGESRTVMLSALVGVLSGLGIAYVGARKERLADEALQREEATASERRRLARELHDGVAQDLAACGYLLDSLTRHLGYSVELSEGFATLRSRMRQITSELRQSLVTLRTEVGSTHTLGEAVAEVCETFSQHSGAPIHVIVDEIGARLPAHVENELFRITQEALTNALKHSCAAEGRKGIEVFAHLDERTASVTVVDHGRGVPSAGRAASVEAKVSNSHGMQIMRERAAAIGGTLTFSDTPGGGLTVAVSVPHHPQRRRLVEQGAKHPSVETTSIPLRKALS